MSLVAYTPPATKGLQLGAKNAPPPQGPRGLHCGGCVAWELNALPTIAQVTPPQKLSFIMVDLSKPATPQVSFHEDFRAPAPKPPEFRAFPPLRQPPAIVSYDR